MEKDRKEGSLAILQGATNFEENLTVKEYSRLLVPKMDLESEDEEYLADYLRGHPLHEELQEALDKNEGHRAEKVSRHIIKDDKYRETIQEKRQFHDRIQHASSRVETLEGKVNQKNERVNELEKRIEELENQSTGTQINNIVEAGASANAKSESEVRVEFNQSYSSLIDRFEQSLPEDMERVLNSLPEEVNEDKFVNPPDEDSSLSQKKEWLQTVSAVATISDTVPDMILQLQPEINELLSAASSLVT